MKCEAKDCNETKDIQYVIVKVATKRLGIGHSKKEFYCQKHLRARILQLEFMRVANHHGKEVQGWK